MGAHGCALQRHDGGAVPAAAHVLGWVGVVGAVEWEWCVDGWVGGWVGGSGGVAEEVGG